MFSSCMTTWKWEWQWKLSVDPQRSLASFLFKDLLKDLAGSLILEFVGEVSSHRFRVGQGASLLVTDESFAIKAGHHSSELDCVPLNMAVDADWHLATARQNSQECSFC